MATKQETNKQVVAQLNELLGKLGNITIIAQKPCEYCVGTGEYRYQESYKTNDPYHPYDYSYHWEECEYCDGSGLDSTKRWTWSDAEKREEQTIVLTNPIVVSARKTNHHLAAVKNRRSIDEVYDEHVKAKRKRLLKEIDKYEKLLEKVLVRDGADYFNIKGDIKNRKAELRRYPK